MWQHLLNRMHSTIDVERQQSIPSRIILVKNKTNYLWLIFIGIVYLFVCKDYSRRDELLVIYFNKLLISGMGHRVNNWKFIGTNGNTELSVFWTDHISILLSRIISYSNLNCIFEASNRRPLVQTFLTNAIFRLLFYAIAHHFTFVFSLDVQYTWSLSVSLFWILMRCALPHSICSKRAHDAFTNGAGVVLA